MNAVSLIRQCRGAGIKLQVHDGRLRVDAPTGAVTPKLRQALTDHKADLLALHAIRARLLALAGELGIPRSVVDNLPVEELAATTEQAAMCDGFLDGHDDPLPHALLVFYLRELARRGEA